MAKKDTTLFTLLIAYSSASHSLASLRSHLGDIGKYMIIIDL